MPVTTKACREVCLGDVYIIKVAYDLQEFTALEDWLFSEPTTTLAVDTETMGVNWLRLRREWEQTDNPDGRRRIESDMAQYSKEALDHRGNYLGCVQLAVDNGRCLIIVTDTEDKRRYVGDMLNSLQDERDLVWLLQNAKFDFHQLETHTPFRCRDDIKLHDTQLNEALIIGAASDASVSLHALTERYDIPKDLVKDGEAPERVSNWWDGLTETQVKYGGVDVLSLYPIYQQQRARLREDNLMRTRKVEMRLTPHITRVEDVGIGFDEDKLYQFLIKAKQKVRDVREEYASVFKDVNPNSPMQVLARVKGHYGVVPVKRQYNKRHRVFVETESVDKTTLLQYGLTSDPAIAAYIAMKEIGKHIQMAEKWLTMDRLYVNFTQLATYSSDSKDKSGGTRSGRFSTSPQMQNIPNFMKQFMVARSDDTSARYVILSSDMAQVELRLVAAESEDPVLLTALSEGRSLHKEMAAEAFGIPVEEVDKKSKQYRISKECNFGFLYGMGGPTFCARVLVATEGDIRLTDEEGWAFRNIFFTRYPYVKYYHQRQHALAALHGYVETRNGRRRYYNQSDRPTLDNEYAQKFWDPMSGGFITSDYNSDACWRYADWRWLNVAKNHPIQGGCADIMKIAIPDICRGLATSGTGTMFATVHDSVDIIVREDNVIPAATIVDKAITQAMGGLYPEVPCLVEHSYGRTWAGAPSDITTKDRGLWVRPASGDIDAYIDTEFQKELIL